MSKKNKHNLLNLNSLINKIEKLYSVCIASNFSSCIFQFVSRSANCLAHNLYNLFGPLNEQQFWWHTLPPPYCNQIICTLSIIGLVI